MQKPMFTLVKYLEFQENMRLLKAYIESLEIAYAHYKDLEDIDNEALEDLAEQLDAVKTIYDNFHYCLEDPHSGPNEADKLN